MQITIISSSTMSKACSYNLPPSREELTQMWSSHLTLANNSTSHQSLVMRAAANPSLLSIVVAITIKIADHQTNYTITIIIERPVRGPVKWMLTYTTIRYWHWRCGSSSSSRRTLYWATPSPLISSDSRRWLLNTQSYRLVTSDLLTSSAKSAKLTISISSNTKNNSKSKHPSPTKPNSTNKYSHK